MVNEPGCVAWPVRSRSVNNAEEYFSNGRKDSDNFRVSIRIEEMDRTENGIHFHWKPLKRPFANYQYPRVRAFLHSKIYNFVRMRDA